MPISGVDTALQPEWAQIEFQAGRATADALGLLWAQVQALLNPEANSFLIDASRIVGLVMIAAIVHEDVSFGTGETSKTVDVNSFTDFENAARDEVFFEFHGPELVCEDNEAPSGTTEVWRVSMDPTTFPTLTFRRELAFSITGGTGDSTHLPAESYRWSMWRRKST